MRAHRLAWIALAGAACTPQITSGSYDCGPNASCPPGESCNIDATCVTTGTETPFACDPMVQHEPDDTPAEAFSIQLTGCVSGKVTNPGCLQPGDAANWVSFKTPSNCATVGVNASLVFPTGFEPLAMQLTDATGATMIATSTACTQHPTSYPGDSSTCVTAALSDSTGYALAVVPAGGGDCGGSCNFNNYTLTLQLVTP